MKDNRFYQVLHKGKSAGFFKTKKNAERCAAEYNSYVEGYSYAVEVKELSFSDDMWDADES
jgi:hypothetical protein